MFDDYKPAKEVSHEDLRNAMIYMNENLLELMVRIEHAEQILSYMVGEASSTVR